MHIIYRTRYVYWDDHPDDPDSFDIVCGAVWTENEVRDLAVKAREKDYLIKSAEVPLAFSIASHNYPESVFVAGQIAMSQSDPYASEFSDFIPLKAYESWSDANTEPQNWDAIWEFHLPWLSPFALSPFKLTTFSDPQMPSHRLSR